jgi:hypothetical protein
MLKRLENQILLNVFWRKKTKGPKQDSQIRSRSFMPEDIVDRMTGTTKRK